MSNEKKWTEKEALELFGKDIQELSTNEIENRCRLLDNEISVFKNDKLRLMHEETTMNEKIKENVEIRPCDKWCRISLVLEIM